MIVTQEYLLRKYGNQVKLIKRSIGKHYIAYANYTIIYRDHCYANMYAGSRNLAYPTIFHSQLELTKH